MKIVLTVIHVIVSLGLIGAVLLHRGKEYGLSMTLGGGMPSTFAGSSIVERNLNRITIGLAVIFAVTTVALYYFTLRGTA